MDNSNALLTSAESGVIEVTPTTASWNSWNATENGWTKDVCITTQEISLAINIVAMCVGLFIIFGNMLVLFVLYKYPAKRFTPFNWLLCHLAVADLSVGVTIFWWYGLAEVLGLLITSYQKVIFYSVSIVAVLASFEGLMMIAIDRYLLILRQTKYWSVITKKRLAVIIGIMWLLPCLIELLGPVLGWSCVEKCDCRIHNLAPDDVYCFGDECSQMLPPLTKHQLFFASCSSFILFLITLVVYLRIFNGVQKQSKKLALSMSYRPRTSTVNSVAATPKHSPNIQSNEGRSSPSSDDKKRKKNHTAWRQSLSTLNEKTSDEMSSGFRLNSFNKSLETPQNESQTEQDENINQTFNDGDFADTDTDVYANKMYRDNKVTSASNNPYEWMIRQESRDSVFTTTTELNLSLAEFPTHEDSIVTNASAKFSTNSITVDTDSQKNSEETDCPTSPDIPVQLRSRAKPRRKSINDFRKSITGNIAKRFSRLTQKTKTSQRSSTTRTRDLRIMRSMFVILSVFVMTTAPLVIFIFYTFFNNDRQLKEIFNILLQVTTLNSFLNPILYFWRLPHMRKRILKLVHAPYWRQKWKIKVSWCRKKPSTTPAINELETGEPSSDSD